MVSCFSMNRLPPIAAPRKSIDSARFDIAELKQASMVINTADYCQTTASEVKPVPMFLHRFIDSLHS